MFRWPWSKGRPERVRPLFLEDQPRPAPTVAQSTWTPPRDLSEVTGDWYPQSVFRRLYEVLTWSEAGNLQDVLAPATPILAPFVQALAPFALPAQSPTHRDELDDGLWALYALSRVNDFLLLHFQDPPVGVEAHENYLTDQDRLTLAGYQEFMAQLGFTPLERRAFHPFFHEIVEIVVDPALGDRVVIERDIWPGYWFGELMLSRSGVAVRVGPTAGIDSIASRSNLYFTYQRRFRPTVDLSMGWGSNSQWRTRFRRDFLSEGQLVFNADGRYLLDETYEARVWAEDRANVREGDGQTLADRISLLRYRCVVEPREDSRDFWTYDDRFVEAAPVEQTPLE